MRSTSKRVRWLGPVLAIAAIALATPALADLNHFISITGATQGAFPGGSDIAPWEGYAIGFEYHHLVERPTSGAAIQHQTVISTVAMDEPLIPHLMRAMELDESLTVNFSFLRPSGTGAEEVYAVVTLLNARVTSLEPLSPTDQDPDLMSYKASVRVRYSYDRILFLHSPTSNTAELINGGS
jgi:type VI secretion system Hcp family effector